MKKNVLIIEDEKHSRTALINITKKCDENCNILIQIMSVKHIVMQWNKISICF